MKIKALTLMVLIVGLLLASVSVSAENFGSSLGVDITRVEVNDVVVTNDQEIRTQFDRGQELEIRVTVQSNLTEVARDVQIEAKIYGDDHFDISDSSDTFDIEPGVVYTEKMRLQIPDLVDRDDYKLRILVSDRYSALSIFNYNLQISTEKNKVSIEDVVFTPSNDVQAGRALLATVRLENFGEEREEGLKVELAIPELGVSAVDYIDELDEDDEISSEELFLRIPRCTANGRYDATVTVSYDDGFEKESKDYYINVVEDDAACAMEAGVPTQPSTPSTQPQPPVTEEKTIINLGTQTNVLTKGEGGAIYPVTLTNQGATAKTYTLSISGVETFGTVRVSPSNVVVVEPYKSEQVFVFVAANEAAAAGAKTFTVTVTSGGELLQAMTLAADVVDSAASADADSEATTKGLWVAVIVLIVLIVLVALLVGFKKMKSGRDGEDDEDLDAGQTYY